MTVFAHIIRASVAFFVYARFFERFEIRIHRADYIDARVNVRYFFVIKRVYGHRAFIMEQTGGVSFVDEVCHFAMIFTEKAFVSERPHYNAGTVFVALHRAMNSVKIRLFKERVIRDEAA